MCKEGEPISTHVGGPYLSTRSNQSSLTYTSENDLVDPLSSEKGDPSNELRELNDPGGSSLPTGVPFRSCFLSF